MIQSSLPKLAHKEDIIGYVLGANSAIEFYRRSAQVLHLCGDRFPDWWEKEVLDKVNF